jgi:hypothetical protein
VTEQEKYFDYLQMLRRPFQKLVRLRFLQPDGSTAFMLDNRTDGERTGALISEGQINHNWQNGQRTSATVTISNVDGEYDYNFNTVWFGQEIALDEGLILSDGQTEFYIQQGVFLIDTPTETVQPAARTVTYNLVDKVAALDGSLGGNLDGTYQVPVGTNIFEPITALLSEDKGNGYPVDRVKPVFTEYYNSKTQDLPDGSTVSMALSPYTLIVDGTDGTIWSVVSGLAAMVNGWVGYDQTGALRIDPSQDDLVDATKPVEWEFSMDEAELLGMTYTVKNTEVYNDYIVIGEQLSDYSQPKGRAQIYDSRSPVDINAIGRKTIRVSQAGFGTDTQCQDYADWMVKRSAVLQRAVTISCSQILHLQGNTLVTLARTDKQGNPVERHLIQGFSRPLTGNGAMQITATSVNDFPLITPQQGELPSEYKRVIGFSMNNDCYWAISDFYLQGSDTVRLSVSLSGLPCNVFGCYTASTSSHNYSLYVGSSGNYLRYNGSTYNSVIPSSALNTRLDLEFTPTGSHGMPTDSTWTQKEFTSRTQMHIGTTSSSATSASLKGSLYGNFVVDGRFKGIPCERISDGVLGYYDTYSATFYAPAVGTPTSLGYA